MPTELNISCFYNWRIFAGLYLLSTRTYAPLGSCRKVMINLQIMLLFQRARNKDPRNTFVLLDITLFCADPSTRRLTDSTLALTAMLSWSLCRLVSSCFLSRLVKRLWRLMAWDSSFLFCSSTLSSYRWRIMKSYSYRKRYLMNGIQSCTYYCYYNI